MGIYDQETKSELRSEVLSRAINALTKDRHGSVIVSQVQMERTLKYCHEFLTKHGVDLPFAVSDILSWWFEFQGGKVGNRSPSQLNVLFLCGPEPLNDIEVLLNLGIAPENIWAVDGDERTASAGPTGGRMPNLAWPR